MEFDLSNLPSQIKEHNYLEPVQGRVAHIDSDFMAYQVSAETKDELDGTKPRKTFDDMCYNARQGLDHQMKMVGATSYIAHLTPSASNKGNRGALALTKEYQGNRKDVAKPEHLQAIRAYIGEALPSKVNLDCEADDSMAMANYAAIERGERHLSVIVSRDKDLRMVPGLHWCYDEEAVIDVDDPFGSIWIDRSKKSAKLLGWGTSFFWAQVLMGDTADNIAGLPHMTVDDKDKNVGPIAAFKLLEDCKTDLECFELIKKLFKESSYPWHDYRDGRFTFWALHMVSDMQLLWMRRKPDQTDVIEWLGELK
jgi:hypothetical protein